MTTKIARADESLPLLAERRDPVRSDALLKTNLVALTAFGAVKEARNRLGHDGPLQPLLDIRSIMGNSTTAAAGLDLISYNPSTDPTQPLMGMALGVLFMAELLKADGTYKRHKFAGEIGDTEGQKLNMASMGISISIGSAGLSAVVERSVRVYDMVQTLQNANYTPPLEMTHTITALGATTMALFGAYNLVLMGVSGYNLYQKAQMKKEVLEQEDIQKWISEKLATPKDMEWDREKCIELALKEGEKWFAKLEKDWKKMGLDRIETTDRAQLVRKLFEMNGDIAKMVGIDKKGEDFLIELGKKIQKERFALRLEQQLARTIGQETIDKYKEGQPIEKTEVIGDIHTGMKKNGWLLFLGALGVVLAVAAIVFTGGLAGTFVAAAFVLSAILWIVGWDGDRLKNNWNGEKTGKYDKAMLIFSSALNIIAVAGTIAAMIIFTGGIAVVPLVLLCTVGLFWTAINIRGTYTLWRHSSRPWEFGKVVSLDSFHKLTQKEGLAADINKYYQKMRQVDKDLFPSDVQDWKGVTQAVVNKINAENRAQLENLHRYARTLA